MQITQVHVIPQNRQGHAWRWCLSGKMYDGDSTELREALTALREAASDEIVSISLRLIIPGQWVGLSRLSFERRELKHLKRLIPYQLEERINGNVEHLHFAFHCQDDNTVQVAYCENDLIQQWLAQLGCNGANPVGAASHLAEVHSIVPLPLLLPWTPGEWTLSRSVEGVSLYWGPGRGFTVEPELLSVALSALLSEEVAPKRLRLLAAEEADLSWLSAQLPSVLSDCVLVPEIFDDGRWMEEGTTSLELCQGPLIPRLPLKRWWKQWRRPIQAMAASVVFYCGVNVFETWQLQQHQQQLQQEIERVYRQVMPRGQLIDAERQLRHQIARMSMSGDSRDSALMLISVVAQYLDEQSGLQVTGMHYSQGNPNRASQSVSRSSGSSNGLSGGGELRLSVEAEQFHAIEAWRRQFEQSPWQVELLQANAQGQRHQARLSIKRSLR